MRSLLFVPADQPQKLDKALASGADALIVDLDDSVAPARKADARRIAAEFVARARESAERPRLLVRINPLSGPDCDADLDAVVAARPEAVVLPKAEGGRDVMHLGAKLAAREAMADAEDGAVRILAIATETGASLFQLGTYAGASRRLFALSWGAEDLSADIGAEANRDPRGFTEPYRIARALLLFGAAAAEVAAIDTVFTAYRDLDGLRAEAEEARRDGFTGKLAIHPAQVPVINEVFTPSAEAVARARAIRDAFAADPAAGVVGLDGEMLDRPHLLRAQRALERAKSAGLAVD
jgi:citrate lyase subunit beta/citryl-CoA lyase